MSKEQLENNNFEVTFNSFQNITLPYVAHENKKNSNFAYYHLPNLSEAASQTWHSCIRSRMRFQGKFDQSFNISKSEKIKQF